MTEPPLPGLAEATARVAEAWSRRSPGEQAAFANRLAALASTSSLPEDALRIVRERAALSGALAPADLVRGIGRERAAQVLDVLASDFDRMLQPDGRWAWMLRAESRQNTLARLTATGQLTTALGQVADIGTDPAGEALRALAATRTLPEADSATKAQALAWAQPLGGFAGDLAEVQRHAAIEWLYASYEVLVRYGVFGRELELTRLRAFAEEQPDPSRPIPLLPVIGMGGVGKSTLLGTFIQPYLDRIAAGDPTCPAVVVIDFDRLLFRPDAELELSFELTRQLGLAAPIAAADFSALRYQVQTEQQQSGSEGFTSGSAPRARPARRPASKAR